MTSVTFKNMHFSIFFHIRLTTVNKRVGQKQNGSMEVSMARLLGTRQGLGMKAEKTNNVIIP